MKDGWYVVELRSTCERSVVHVLTSTFGYLRPRTETWVYGVGDDNNHTLMTFLQFWMFIAPLDLPSFEVSL